MEEHSHAPLWLALLLTVVLSAYCFWQTWEVLVVYGEFNHEVVELAKKQVDLNEKLLGMRGE